ncbi:hypothetical protein HY251_12640 [bacterium]|nr:hypothetical protein [bacterium]
MAEGERPASEPRSPSGRLSVERRFSPDARCAFCHDALDDESAVCPGCKTVLHRDCRALLPECPTLGCRLSVFTLVPENAPPRPIRTRPAFRAALARLAERQPVQRFVPTPPRPGEQDSPPAWVVTHLPLAPPPAPEHARPAFARPLWLFCIGVVFVLVVVGWIFGATKANHPKLVSLVLGSLACVGGIFAFVARKPS